MGGRRLFRSLGVTSGEWSGTGTAMSGRRLLRSRFLLAQDRYHTEGGKQSGTGTAMGGRRRVAAGEHFAFFQAEPAS